MVSVAVTGPACSDEMMSSTDAPPVNTYVPGFRSAAAPNAFTRSVKSFEVDTSLASTSALPMSLAPSPSLTTTVACSPSAKSSAFGDMQLATEEPTNHRMASTTSTSTTVNAIAGTLLRFGWI